MRADVELGDVLVDVGVGVAKGAQMQAPADGEWGLLRLGALRSQLFDSSQAKRLQSWDPAYERLEIRESDVLMVRVNGAPALVGATCVARGVRPRLVLSDLMYRLVPDEKKVSPEFLGLVLNAGSVRHQIRTAMRGTSGQFQLPQAEVKTLKIPDVPLLEQRRIVAVHAAFERRISALQRVLAKIKAAGDAVAIRVMANAPGLVPLGTWLQRIEAGKSPLAEDTPAGDGQWGVLKVSAVRPGWFKGTENKVVHEPDLINPQYEVRAGDLIMTRANTEQLVGLACIARNPSPRLMLSDKTLRLVPDQSVADPEFMELTLLTPAVRMQVRAMATGTSGSMKNIGQEAVRQLLVPDVPTLDQAQVVAAVAASRKRVESVAKQIAKTRIVQQATAEELLRGAV
ncbi:hypothetical protein ABZ424_15545 [Streptomyces sp. NPDC005790]|uniref:hypothetical protein n=1 Tax=Streptomyces sp. NPDC005790 TaxID=3154777 RepID=UPI0033EDBD02